MRNIFEFLNLVNIRFEFVNIRFIFKDPEMYFVLHFDQFKVIRSEVFLYQQGCLDSRNLS